jgi:hypothetical protein
VGVVVCFKLFGKVHDPRSVITPAAYILFYQRRDSRFPPGVRISNPVKYIATDNQEVSAEKRRKVFEPLTKNVW